MHTTEAVKAVDPSQQPEQAIISIAMKHNQVIKVVSVYDDHAKGDMREFFLLIFTQNRLQFLTQKCVANFTKVGILLRKNKEYRM